jgi:replicative DNA helicase
MASYERKLLSKAVQDDGVVELISQGIEARHFSDKESKELWNFLTEHIKNYRKPPSFEVVKENFEEYRWEITPDPLPFLKDKFISQVKRREAIGAFSDLTEILDANEDSDMAKIDEIFLDKAKDLAQIVPSSNISKFSQMQSRIDSYRERKEQGIQIGIPFGIPKLDELTLGLQSHQYVTIAGFTGVGKSTLGMVLSVHHYLEGANPMIISLEMDEEEIYRKLDAIAVGIKQHAIKEMTLSPNEMKKWEKWADRAEKAANDIIVVDVDFATPEKVYAETARWNPDVVVVDYVQLMSAPNHFKQTWEKVGYVSQMLKMQARQLRIPVYGIAQTNAEGMTEGANLGNLGGSKDIGKHSDIVIGLKQDETMYEMDRMDINVVKNRAGPKGHFSMLWDQANAIFRPWMGEDAYRKKEIA